jgi:hypothetical protein
MSTADLAPNAFYGCCQPKGDIAICHIGGEQPFAASARSKERREESGRSGHLPVFSVAQTRRMAAVSPIYQMPSCSISHTQKIQVVALGSLPSLVNFKAQVDFQPTKVS